MPTLKAQEKKRIIEKAQKELGEIQRTVYRDDFEALTKGIVEAIRKIDARLLKDLEEIKGLTNKEREDLKQSFDKSVNSLEVKIQTTLSQALKKQEDSLNFMRDWVRDLRDGKDADPEEVAKLASQMIEFPEQQTPQEIYDAILVLKADKEAMEKEIEKLKKRPAGRIGGGHTDVGVKHSLGRLVKTETPSGDIDSVNVTFIVSGKISAVISYHLGDKVVSRSDFSFANNTITWNTAPNAVFSGKTHELVYI